jgi:hypothetical protein
MKIGSDRKRKGVLLYCGRNGCVKMKDFSNQREKARYYRSLSGERKTEAFCEMLEESGMTVFLGGAGVSTESGIPDFRSKKWPVPEIGQAFFKIQTGISSERQMSV